MSRRSKRRTIAIRQSKRDSELLVRVYGHPRAGNNLLCAFLALNFYPGQNFVTFGRIGHWRNRLRNQRNEYGKLAGTHLFYHDRKNKIAHPCVYVYRDGRAVALSLWRTKKFQAPEWADLTFSEFLRKPLDWSGSPGNPKGFGQPIAAHWHSHLQSWENAPEVVDGKPAVLRVRFENLILQPDEVYHRIAAWSGLNPVHGLKLVTEKVGWFPHEGSIDGWKEHFTDDDLGYFYKLAPKPFWGYYDLG